MENSMFGNFDNPDVDKVYQLYANLYYDYCDSNLNHFFNRGIDTRPIAECHTDEECVQAYITEIKNLCEYALSMNVTKESLISEHPELKEIMS